VEDGRDISNQRLQTYTLDRDRPEVTYIQLDKGYIILTCFWIRRNWAVAKRIECLCRRNLVAGTPVVMMELAT
jgi:hypothetical protein